MGWRRTGEKRSVFGVEGKISKVSKRIKFWEIDWLIKQYSEKIVRNFFVDGIIERNKPILLFIACKRCQQTTMASKSS